ncbi:MAG: acyl-CoA dehydrogenase family protein [Acidimicrobiia bacterium]
MELGWLGLHLPEAHGGSGFGLEELVVVVEQLGREVTPGPFVPTVVASALVCGVRFRRPAGKRLLPVWPTGSTLAAVGTGGWCVAERHFGVERRGHGAECRPGVDALVPQVTTSWSSTSRAAVSRSNCPPSSTTPRQATR